MVVVCYLDDCFFIASSVEALRAQVGYALHFIHSLGLTINVRKSVLEPTQRVTFLNVVLDSVSLTLPSCRRERTREKGLLLLNRDITLQDLSSFIGLAVASGPAVELAPLRYRYVEIIRIRDLSRSYGNYHSCVV